MTITTTNSANSCLDPYRTGTNRTVTDQLPCGGPDWNQIQDGDLDSITVEATSTWYQDPVAAIRAWRRTLKEGGTLAVALPTTANSMSPQAFTTLVKLVGGFLHGGLRPVQDGTLLFVGNRSRVADIRAPFAVLGDGLVKAAADTRARAELYFQIGTVLLQVGDYQTSLQCFENLKTLEPESAEALYGLGMCETLRGNFGLAIGLLEQAAARDPRNPQIQTWIDLARASANQMHNPPAATRGSAAPGNPNQILNPQPATGAYRGHPIRPAQHAGNPFAASVAALSDSLGWPAPGSPPDRRVGCGP